MIEFERIGLRVPAGASEFVNERTPGSKKFLLPDGRYNIKAAAGLLHYGEELDDIDIEPVERAGSWFVDRAPYTLEVDKTKIEFLYQGKVSGREIHIALQTIEGGLPVIKPCLSEGHDVGHAVRFPNVLGSGDISILLNPMSVQTEHKILAPTGIKTVIWKVRQNFSNPIVLETLVRGFDANKHKAEIEITRSSTQRRGAFWEYTLQERFTGNRRIVDLPLTRVERTAPGAVYPVIIRG
jgi:hypothetical protein